MKKTIDAQTTFDSRSLNFKTSFNKKRSRNKKRENKNSFNDKTKTKNRRKNIDEKKRKRSNHSHFICYKCNEVKHMKIKKRLNIVFHLQTNEQIERQNQNLKHFLRVFCFEKQTK